MTMPRWFAPGLSLAVCALVVAFVAEPVRVPSESMAPTLRPGDHLLVDKTPGTGRTNPDRGQLVVFTDPVAGELLVKRVAAVAGDRVAIDNGVLTVNGQPVPEPYLDPAGPDRSYLHVLDVPAGSIFVLGDNRACSVDSRTFGPVPTRLVVGRVLGHLPRLRR